MDVILILYCRSQKFPTIQSIHQLLRYKYVAYSGEGHKHLPYIIIPSQFASKAASFLSPNRVNKIC
jgi:hypothetical protein